MSELSFNRERDQANYERGFAAGVKAAAKVCDEQECFFPEHVLENLDLRVTMLPDPGGLWIDTEQCSDAILALLTSTESTT